MKLGISIKRKTGKFMNTWKLNSTLLNNQWNKKEIKGEIFKFLETNENGNIACQNMWDAAKAVLRDNFIAINA